MQLSVIVPTNNLTHRTINTIESLKFSQTNYEVLVVVDSIASDDIKIAKKLSTMDDVKLLYSTYGQGISNTLNYGLHHATGDVILRIDDGDINLRSDLSEEISLLDKYDLICASMSALTDNHRKNLIIKPRIRTYNGRLSPFARVPHPTWIFKRSSDSSL